jgi:hypothetical protein
VELPAQAGAVTDNASANASAIVNADAHPDDALDVTGIEPISSLISGR